ncbi:MAG: sulfite exporter TauE/SafE family protein [Nitrososphaerales archaeon]
MLLVLPFFVVVLVIFVLGVVTGGLSNVTSGGAGLFTIYLLTDYGGLVIQKSTGTVLAASTVIVMIGALSFQRKKQVNTFLAITVGLSGVAGAFFAAEWASSINPSSLERYFGIFTLALAFYTSYRFISEWREQKKISNDHSGGEIVADSENVSINASKQEYALKPRFAGKDPLSLAIQVTTGALIGVATGLFGVGLASLSIVLFMLLFRLDMKTVLGTSLFASFFRYLGGSAGYLATAQIDLFYFVILVVGGALGSIIGARMVLGGGRASKDSFVKLIIVGMLLFISYEYLLKHLIFH